jgi:hypothetical protein
MSLRPKHIDFGVKWKSLEADLSVIFDEDPIQETNGMNLFTDVYEMCVATPKPFTEQLYSEIKGFLIKQVQKIAEVYSADSKNVFSSSSILDAYSREWNGFNRASKYLSSICEYLNKLIDQSNQIAMSPRRPSGFVPLTVSVPVITVKES